MRRRSLILSAAIGVSAMLIAPAAAAAQESSNPGMVRDGHHWLLRDSLTSGPATTSFSYGRSGDQKLMCDWNGDGDQTPGVVREGYDGPPVWLLRNERSSGVAEHEFVYGRQGDTPVCGDWNGDGTQTPGVVREDANGRYSWFLRNENSAGPAHVSFVYGRDHTPGTLPPTWPVTGDWNGNGQDTIGIVRGHDDGQMNWLLRDSNSAGWADHDFWYYDGGVWGDHLERHVPVVGDWNGDGRYGPGVTRASGAESPQWLLRNDRSAGTADHVFYYGRHMDISVTWR
jgi:hypothetical protein